MPVRQAYQWRAVFSDVSDCEIRGVLMAPTHQAYCSGTDYCQHALMTSDLSHK